MERFSPPRILGNITITHVSLKTLAAMISKPNIERLFQGCRLSFPTVWTSCDLQLFERSSTIPNGLSTAETCGLRQG